MSKLKVLDLFSGIGGFSLGLERTGGFETVAFCEIDPFCQKVLAKHWPDVRQYNDVRELTAERLAADGITVDVITGGFPCQDISVAGKGAGLAGERSGLWSEIARLVSELRPRFVIVENVSALLSRGLGTVLGDLAEIGYDAEWHCIPASYVGAHHRRDRVWIMAHPQSQRGQQQTDEADTSAIAGESGIGFISCRASMAHSDSERELQSQGCEQDKRGWAGNSGKNVANVSSQRQPRQGEPVQSSYSPPRLDGQTTHAFASRVGQIWRAEPNVGRVAHGIPVRMDRLKSLGNSVVPQVVELLGNAILQAEKSA